DWLMSIPSPVMTGTRPGRVLLRAGCAWPAPVEPRIGASVHDPAGSLNQRADVPCNSNSGRSDDRAKGAQALLAAHQGADADEPAAVRPRHDRAAALRRQSQR